MTFRAVRNRRRVERLITAAVDDLKLDLTGIDVLTEAGSGAFAVTPLIAGMARAQSVRAVVRDSRFATAAEVIDDVQNWAASLGLPNIQLHKGTATDIAAGAHVVTNLGFVRPIDASVVSQLADDSVVCLMWEPWEFRHDDVDLEACVRADVPVVATNERHPHLRTFEYLGPLAVKLVLEAELELVGCHLVVVGSPPFGPIVRDALVATGAVVRLIGPSDCATFDLDGVDGVVLAEHRSSHPVVGQGALEPQALVSRGITVVHIAGVVAVDSATQPAIDKHPPHTVRPFHMAVTTDHVGPRPVVDLHAAGLRVGEIVVRARRRGATPAEAVDAAVASGFALRLEPDV